ncbi:MAG: hypothetical protein HKN19_18555 [Halioglobus sp.]|nr:hypothetical protein [Halioglobus sp.]
MPTQQNQTRYHGLTAILGLLLVVLSPVLGATTPVFDYYAGEGPWTVAVDAETYASGQTGMVYRPIAASPAEIFPVVVWGNGSGADPEINYPVLLRRIASYGFVVTATNHQQVGTGEQLLESLDHLKLLEADVGYVLHGQIDFGKVGAVGHSQGAGGSTKSVIDTDDIHTLVPLALPAPQFVFEVEKEYDVTQVDVPMFILGAVGDFISDTDTVQMYFAQQPDASAMAMIANSPVGFPHLEWSENGGGVSRAYIIAWLDYILRGDATAAMAFTGAAPEFMSHPDFTAQDMKCLPGGELPLLIPQDSVVNEGNSGTTIVEVTIELSNACDREVMVNWTTIDDLGQPEPGIDYEADAGVLVFAAGQTAATIPFTIYGDEDFEPDSPEPETAMIELSGPTNARLGAAPTDAIANISIRNDDYPGCD